MKKFLFLLIAVWVLNFSGSEKQDKWIVFYENHETGEVHKCKEEDYPEVKEMLIVFDSIATIKYDSLTINEIEYNSVLRVRSVNDTVLDDQSYANIEDFYLEFI